jgi:uncharacterized membrane protein
MTKFDRFFWVFILIEAIGIIGGLYMPVGYGLIICWVGGGIYGLYLFTPCFKNTSKIPINK